MSLKSKPFLQSSQNKRLNLIEEGDLRTSITLTEDTILNNNILDWTQSQQRSERMVVQLPGTNFQHHHHHHLHHQSSNLIDNNINLGINIGNSAGESLNGGNGGALDNSPGSSTASNADVSGGGGSGDAEGVWSADIDQAFHEALQIYPPCGRRKIILSDEGKMYGRNELIARYIKIRCGKTRTRKQVSSHIQVLARKKQREIHSKVKMQDSKFDGDFNCDGSGGDLSVDFGGSGGIQKMSPEGASSPASSSCLDVSTTSSLGSSILPGTSNGVKSLLPPALLKDGVNGLNSAIKLETLDNALLTSSHSGLNILNMNGAGAIGGLNASNSMAVTSSCSGSAVAATAALAAVAAAGIGGTAPAPSWPYGVNAAAAAASSMFNNYYTASMINDENIYQQFAAALAAGASLSNAPNMFNSTTTSTTARSFLDPQLQNQNSNNNLQQFLPSNIQTSCSQGAAQQQSLFDCTISSSKLLLCGLTAYIEQADERIDLVKVPRISDEPLETIKLEDIQSKYPPILEELFEKGPADAFFLIKCWANVSFDIFDERSALYAVDSYYNSKHNFDISVSTKVCSFGNQVVEKVEVYSPVCDDENAELLNTSLYQYRLEKSPMCDYMVRFIAELKKLDARPLMNSVLDNFTVLQIVTNKANNETLMVIAFIFEISPEPESTCRIYRLAS